jgi:hypothetical protein
MKRFLILALVLVPAIAFAQGKPASGGGSLSNGIVTTTISASGLFSSSVASGSTALSLTSGAKLQLGASTRYITDDGTNLVVKGSIMPKDTVSYDFGSNGLIWGTAYLHAVWLNSGQIRDNTSTARITLSSGSVDLGNPLKVQSATLATCASGTEGNISRDAAAGGTSGHRTRVCLCTSDGAGTPGYKWQNMVSGTLGTTTTCAD